MAASFPSKYESSCSNCHGWINVGTFITYDRTAKKAAHAQCPEQPSAAPSYVQVEVAPRAAELNAELSAAKAAIAPLYDAQLATEKARNEARIALGWCQSCNGSGYIHAGWDTDYDCNHGGEKALPAPHGRSPLAIDASAEVAPLAQAARAARDATESAQRRIERAQHRLEELQQVRKGDVVRVAKGRKVKVGTVGTVKWLGDGNFGLRVGLAVEGQQSLVYTAYTNVAVVSHSERVVEVAAKAA